jgi:hypothetical protein
VGLPVIPDTSGAAAPRPSALRRLRRLLGFAPFFRAFVPVEFTLLALSAAVVDAIRDDLLGSRALLIVLLPIGIVTAGGHLIGVLTSNRLR